MTDYGAQFTDRQLASLEKQIRSVYTEAKRDIDRKLEAFNARHKEKEAIYKEKLKTGEITQDEYKAWQSGQVFQGNQWKAKKKQVENILYNANSEATKIINGGKITVLAENANYMAYTLEHGVGINFGFGLYDSTTVTKLIKDQPDLLPYKKVNKAKDKAWNRKKITRQVTQGIIQGESLDDVAKRIASVTDQNWRAMRTSARTAMTGAQNAGRQIRLEEANQKGIKVKKEWMCTLDMHTRDAHRELDGQKVDTDKPFEVDGQKIMYPGDPTAAAYLVFNCRCTMVGDIDDFPAKYQRYDNIEGHPVNQMTYKEWEEAKKTDNKTTNKVVQGKDISETWQRRSDQFDFEIEDVINAQGFDGLPRVVNAEEFDRYVQAANDGNGFIAQRTYSAPDQETLEMYRDQLYNGKWYVDCSTGGAQYGQGMYCAADYTGTLTDGIKTEMKHYQDLGESRTGNLEKIRKEFFAKLSTYEKNSFNMAAYGVDAPTGDKELGEKLLNQLRKLEANAKGVSYTETLTLDPSAKIITWDEVDRMMSMDKEHDYEWFKSINWDEGIYATMMGYDAINAVGHGQSGSYTVILNRTKVIIKGE